jgi:hypothetical protein
MFRAFLLLNPVQGHFLLHLANVDIHQNLKIGQLLVIASDFTQVFTDQTKSLIY